MEANGHTNGHANGHADAPNGVAVNGASSDDLNIAQLEALSASINEAIKAYKESASGSANDLKYRRKIEQSASELLNATKAPEEQWNTHSVLMAEIAAIRTFMSWRVFDAIPLEGSITYEELATKVEADLSTLRRLAWIMVSTGTLKQVKEDSVAHTRLSRVYANRHPSGMLFQIMFDEAMIPWAHLNYYFEKYGRKEPTDPFVNPHTYSYNKPGTHYWEIVYGNPQRMTDFMQSMNTLEQLLPITGMYDFSWLVEKSRSDPETSLLVDVGGGKGQALRAILKEYADIPKDKCILQDQSFIIDQAAVEHKEAPGLEGLQLMAHDFFKEQPVKGAYIYYIRRCLHDWSDENCAKILRHLGDALHPEGRVLICEQIMSNPPSSLTAQTDLCMMNVGGKERTAQMFEELAAMSGLKVVKIHKSDATDVGVVECVKA